VGKGVNVLGDVLIGGTAGKIVLGDIADAHRLLIGAPGAANGQAGVDITLGRVAELSIFSGTAISSLSVQEWLDLDATPDIVQTPWIGKLTSDGDFMAGLLLDGTGAPNGTLGTTRIRGDLREAIWTIVGSMGKFTVDGTVTDSTIQTTAGMGKITVGAADGADFLAGVADAVSRHADLAGDFANPAAFIEGFSVKGLKNGAAARYFQDSNLSAATMGAVDLLNAEFDNGGTKFGLYALSAGTGKEIKSVKYSDTVTRAKWKYPWDPAEAPDTQDFEIRVI
jgi:hypothetical protein